MSNGGIDLSWKAWSRSPFVVRLYNSLNRLDVIQTSIGWYRLYITASSISNKNRRMMKYFLRLKVFTKIVICNKGHKLLYPCKQIQTTKLVNCSFFTFSSFLIFSLNANHFRIQTLFWNNDIIVISFSKDFNWYTFVFV